jgi:hypothetical protein
MTSAIAPNIRPPSPAHTTTGHTRAQQRRQPLAVDREPSSADAAGRLLRALTSNDRAVLAAATGFDVTDSGQIRDPGNRIPPWGLFLTVAGDRRNGSLVGPADAAYFNAAFARADAAGAPLDPRHLVAVLAFLDATADAAVPRPVDLLA